MNREDKKVNLGLLHENLTYYLKQYTNAFGMVMTKEEIEEKFIKSAEVEDE